MDSSKTDWHLPAARQVVSEAITVWKELASGPRPAREDYLWKYSELASETDWVGLSLPRISVSTSVHWLGQRLVWWPYAPEGRKRLSVVTSRLGKRKDLQRWWFDALRTLALRCDAEAECLCVVDGTAAVAAVKRVSELFGIHRLRLELSDETVTSPKQLTAWLEQVRSEPRRETSELESLVVLSPRLVTASKAADNCQQSSPGHKPVPPVKDTALVVSAERIISLNCRRRGNVETLLTRHLMDSERKHVAVLAASAPDSPAVPDSITALGAIPWILEEPEDPVRPPTVIDEDAASSSPTIADEPSGPLNHPDDWLCHWTRPVSGPWRDQPGEEFLDELILGCATADRSAFAALMRMVTQGRMMATVSVRNEPPTVSFTAVALADFRARRVFRAHRQRYDFEPWGLAIRKVTLQRLGGQPVQYIDSASQNIAVRAQLTQPRCDAKGNIDWSEEQEWRVPGDVAIGQLPAGDVVIFVDSEREAATLRQICPWSVIVVPT